MENMDLDQRVNKDEHARQSQQAEEEPDKTCRGYQQPKARTFYGKPTGCGLGGTSEGKQDFGPGVRGGKSSEGRNVFHTKYLS